MLPSLIVIDSGFVAAMIRVKDAARSLCMCIILLLPLNITAAHRVFGFILESEATFLNKCIIIFPCMDSVFCLNMNVSR